MVISIQQITDFICTEATELQIIREELAKAMELEQKYNDAVKAAEEKYDFHTKKLDDLQATHNKAQSDYTDMKNKNAEMEKNLQNHKDAHADTHKSLEDLKKEHETQLTTYGAAAAALENQIVTKRKALKDLQSAVDGTRSNYKKLECCHKVTMDKLKTASDVEIALDMEKANKATWQADLDKLNGDYVDASGQHESWAKNHRTIQQELLDLQNGTASQDEIEDLKRRLLAEQNAVKTSDIPKEDKHALLAEDKQDLLCVQDDLKTKHDEADCKIKGHTDSFAELKEKYESMWIKYQSLVTQNSLLSQQVGQAQGNLLDIQEFCKGNVATVTKAKNALLN